MLPVLLCKGQDPPRLSFAALFLQNCLDWLLKPVEESNVFSFTLNQLGIIQNEIKELNNTTNNMIETMTILEKRISILEEALNKNKNEQTKK